MPKGFSDLCVRQNALEFGQQLVFGICVGQVFDALFNCLTKPFPQLGGRRVSEQSTSFITASQKQVEWAITIEILVSIAQQAREKTKGPLVQVFDYP